MDWFMTGFVAGIAIAVVAESIDNDWVVAQLRLYLKKDGKNASTITLQVLVML